MIPRTIASRNRQTIWDIAIQEYGGIDGVRLLIADNNGDITYNTTLTDGRLIKVKSDPVDKDTYNFFNRNRLKPVSSVPADGKLGGDFNNDFNNDFN